MKRLEQLTRNERTVLKEYESTISEQKDSFFRVGFALQEIRDRRLYRADYRTFDEYLLKRWGFTRDYASKLITGAETGAGLYTTVYKDGIAIEVNPTRETQVRPLKALAVEQRKEAWKRAVTMAGGNHPDEKTVRAVVAEMRPSARDGASDQLNINPSTIVRRAIGVLRTVSNPSENIKAAIELLTRTLDDGSESNQSND